MADLKGKGKVVEQEQASKAEPSYVVYVRLPFSRGDFEDPPPVCSTTSFLLQIGVAG
jgi:hypothetical protein